MDKESTRPKAKKPKFPKWVIVTAIVLVAVIVLAVVLTLVAVFVVVPRFRSTDHYMEGTFSVSPDSNTVVFSYLSVTSLGGETTSSIYAQDLGTGVAVRLTDANSVWHVRPEFSPDGSKILYLSEDQNKKPPARQVWVMNADGGNQTQLTSGNVFVQHAIFSPDSRSVYLAQTSKFDHDALYDTYSAKDFALYKMDLSTKKMLQLANVSDTKEIDRMSITSDGSTLLWGTYMNAVYTLDLRTNATKEMGGLGKAVVMPQISGDGRSLAYINMGSEKGGPPLHVAVRDIANGTSKDIADCGQYGAWPTYFESGAKVMYLEQKPEASSGWSDYHIKYVDLSGTNATTVELYGGLNKL